MKSSASNQQQGRNSSGATSLHYGYVSAVDETTGRARVRLEDMDNFETYWLPIPQRRVQVDQAVDWLDVGDYVGLLLDESGEQGIILGAFYSSKNPPPVTSKDLYYRRFADGAVIEYDRSQSHLQITCPGTITIEAAGNMTLRGARIDLNP